MMKYLKIVYDDINQLIELVESYQETVNSTRELYMASISLQMNDTIKTLTIFSSILLPLTFTAIVYGMNGLDLNNLGNPPAGFVVVTVTMVAIAIILLVFFRTKKWIFVRVSEPHTNRTHSSKLKES